METPLVKRFELLRRSHHYPKPMMDLLALLVTSCDDTDRFKAKTQVRLASVEEVANLPTKEVENARAMAVNELNALEVSTKELQASLRTTETAIRAEVQLHLTTLRNAVRDFEGQKAHTASDIQHIMNAALQDFQVESRRTVENAVIQAKQTIDNTFEMYEGSNLGTEVIQKDIDARVAVAMEQIQRARESAAAELSEATSNAVDLLSTARETFDSLPLLECHRLQGCVQVCEAKVNMLERSMHLKLKNGPGLPNGLDVSGTFHSNKSRDGGSPSPHRWGGGGAGEGGTSAISGTELVSMEGHHPEDDLRAAVSQLAVMVKSSLVDKMDDLNDSLTAVYDVLQLDPKWCSLFSRRLQQSKSEVLGGESGSGTRQSSSSSFVSYNASSSPSRRGLAMSPSRYRAPISLTQEAAVYLSSLPTFGQFLKASLPVIGLELSDASECSGVVVMSIVTDSPASRTELMVSDKIVAVDSKRIGTRKDFEHALRLAMAAAIGDGTADHCVVSLSLQGGAVRFLKLPTTGGQ